MAPTIKHGGHRFPLDLPAIAAGTAASSMMTYDFNDSLYGVYDAASEVVDRATLIFAAAVTGAATNNVAAELTHRNSAGTIQNQIVYTFGAGVNAAAYVPIDLTGPPAGALTNPTGVPVANGWVLSAGDSVEAAFVANGTGLAVTKGASITIQIGAQGS